MPASVQFSVTVDASQIQQAVYAIIRRINEALKVAVPSIEDVLRQRVTRAFEESPEYQSILGGELWHQLGIEQPRPVLTSLLNALVRSIKVHNFGVGFVAGQAQGGLKVEILRRDLAEVLSLPEASYVSVNRYGKANKVEWLEWLLLEGDAIVLGDYRYIGIQTEGSRTGLGLMVPSETKGWRVPSEFAGTIDDNWLTRALATVIPDFPTIFETEVGRALS